MRGRPLRWLAPLLLLSGLAAAQTREDPAAPPLTALDFRGNEKLADEELRGAIPLKINEPLGAERLAAARTILLSYYKGRGYAEAQVSAAAEAEGQGVRAVFTIREGPLYRFGETRVTGLTAYPDRTVYRELTYKKGDPYLQGELFNSQGRLHNLGLFQDIRIRTSTQTAAPQTMDVEISMRARPTRTIKGGVGYGSEERQRLSLTYTDRNLFRRAYTMDLTAEYSAIWLETRASLLNRYIFGTRTESHNSISWRHEERDGYQTETTQGRTSLARELWYSVSGEAAYRLQRTNTYDLSPAVAATTPENSLISAVEGSLSRDRTDDPFFPTRGSRLGLTAERAGGILGGNTHFNKFTVSAAFYAKVFGPLSAAFVARGGAVRPFLPSSEVPIFEKFFSGGANSVRGYRERGVGPKDAGGNPLGGKVETGSSLEFRFPLVKKLRGAVFVDGGQVADSRAHAQPSEWKYGAGGGIRYVTPVGPLRLDYGYKLNRDPGDDDLWRIHFSLGEAF